jgi:cytochrome P450
MSDPAPAPVLGLNPFEPGFYENPYDQYAELRENDPVFRSPLGSWVITRWADVHTILRRPGMSVEDRNVNGDSTRRDRLADLVPGREVRRSLAILNIDPPDHTRIRRLVSRAFTPRSVEQIRERTGLLVDEILDDLATRGEPVDLISELAFPLPFAVISEMLGMPEGDRAQLRTWSHTVTQILDPILAMENAAAIFEAIDQMNAVVADAITWKRGRPDDDDLLQAMIRAEDDGDVLSDEELVANVVLLYLAGHETTVNLIGNGVTALLRDRPQLERLVADPSLDANAIEELLRYDSPVQFSRRVAMDDFEIGGEQIRAGEMVMTCLGAANRDPRKFGDDADRLDLGRETAREHVSFGSGVHHCLGAALARLEGQEVIGRLVRRFPDLTEAGEATMNGRIVLRGRDELPISLEG